MGTKKAKDDVVASNEASEASNEAICLPDRDAKVAELAYHKAESRGFEPGHELDDWLEAEHEYSCSLTEATCSESGHSIAV